MRGVQGRAPDLAQACRGRRSDGFVQLRVDIPPALKDRLIRGARAHGTTLRAYVEWTLYNGLESKP